MHLLLNPRFDWCSHSSLSTREAVFVLQILYLPWWFLPLKGDYPSPIPPLPSFCFRACRQLPAATSNPQAIHDLYDSSFSLKPIFTSGFYQQVKGYIMARTSSLTATAWSAISTKATLKKTQLDTMSTSESDQPFPANLDEVLGLTSFLLCHLIQHAIRQWLVLLLSIPVSRTYGCRSDDTKMMVILLFEHCVCYWQAVHRGYMHRSLTTQ